MEFRTKLIKARSAKGFTQEELAEKCNVTARTIQRIESGQVQPRAHTIKAISNALDFDFFSSKEVMNYHSIFWFLKDLFNLKTQTMKKISILSFTTIAVILATSFVVNEAKAQSADLKPKNGITITYNHNQIERVDVVFTSQMTLDSLVAISNELKEHKILLSYTSMTFNNTGHLTSIGCKMSENGYPPSGSFAAYDMNGVNKETLYGFYYDYSEKEDEPVFCAGGCW